MRKFVDSILWAQRKLLMIWVKVSVVPSDPSTLGLTSERPVFYILETRSLSNLLILEQQCIALNLPRPTETFSYEPLQLRRSASALRRWEGFWRLRPSKVSYSQTLQQLLEYAIRHSDTDILLAPVTVFWGRRPDKNQGWFQLLFAEPWSKVGRLRKFFIILAHGRNTWLQFSTPVSVREFLDPELSSEQNVRKLSRVLRVHFRQLRSATIGPELSNRHAVVQQVLAMPNVQRALKHEIHEDKLSAKRALARARRYAYEIAADFSYPFILLMRRLLRRLWDRLYNGVVVRHAGQIRRIAPGNTIVYLPCHRSHIDYLLLSYVLHDEGLAIPYVAAGINLNIPLIGPWLRRGGAFFLRRSFRGNRLYGAVFQAYLAWNLARGTPLEYFIEGGRSRTGRSLQPKLGMLDMTVRAFLNYPQRSMTLAPVYIGYEKLVEGRSYLAELSGQAKRKESLGGFFRGLRALRSEFGKVHLNFGEPLDLGDFIDRHQDDWREQEYPLSERPEWLPPLIERLGAEIMIRINAAADANTVNLLALALLATPNNAMDERDLCVQIDIYRQLQEFAPYSPWSTLSAESGEAVVQHALQLGLIKRQTHSLGDIIQTEKDQAILLSYFANNVLHLFALPGLVACCLRRQPRSEDELQTIVQLVYPFIQRELFLPWQTEELPSVLKQCLSALAQQGLIEVDTQHIWHPLGNTQRLYRLADCVTPMLERYYLTTVVLIQAGPGQLDQAQLEQRSQQLAQRLAILFGLRTPDYYDRGLFHTYLQTLRSTGLLQADEAGRLRFVQDIVAKYRPLWQLLSPPVRHSIAQLTGGDELCE